MNVIARLEFELVYYDSAVHRFNHYTTRISHKERRENLPFQRTKDWKSNKAKRETDTWTLIQSPPPKKKRLWYMRVTMIPNITGTFGTVSKDLKRGLEEMEIGEQTELIQIIELLRSSRILKRVLETWRDLMSLRLAKSKIILRYRGISYSWPEAQTWC